MRITDSCYSSGKFTQRTKTLFGAEQGLPCDDVLCVEYDGEGTLWAGTSKGLAFFNGEKFVPVTLDRQHKDSAVKFLCADRAGIVWTACGNAVYACKNNRVKKIQELDGEAVDVASCADRTYLITETSLYKLSNGEWVFDMELDGAGKKVAAFGDSVYVLTESSLLAMAGKRRHWKGILPMFSDMPECSINDIVFDELGYLWLATDEGLCLYDENSYWVDSSVIGMLPKEKIYTIKTDNTGCRYMASDCGVIYQQDGLIKYFGAYRWLPDTLVRDVAVSAFGDTFWAATSKGLSRITSRMMTLREKADYYQETVEKYHVRDGYVTVVRNVENDDLSVSRVEISDNDGLWTANYLAAQTYRYAVTGDREALELAKRSMRALIYLMDITGIPGFTARAIRRAGEKDYGDGDPEWHLSQDGSCEWKGETSSDEMTGHFFALSLFYDMCADEEEKAEIRRGLCGIVDHILDNDFRLCDCDGKPTTWANWNPLDLNHSDKWVWEKGVNSLEILAFLKVAYHISGSDKYDSAYKELITKHHYAINIAQHKVLDGHVTHIDDNLAFLASSTLLRLEKNEGVRRLLLMGMTHHWNYEKIERTPLWNFMYGAYTGLYCDLEAAVQSMREMPLSLIRYKTVNSNRKGLVLDTEQEQWGEPPQLKEPLPYDERPLCKYDNNPFRIDGGDSASAEDGTMYLLPYWFARYHKLIKETEEN